MTKTCERKNCIEVVPKERRKYCSQRCGMMVNDLKYYYRNKANRTAYQRKYYNKHKDDPEIKAKKSIYYKTWYQKNKEKQKIYMRKYMVKYNKRLKNE